MFGIFNKKQEIPEPAPERCKHGNLMGNCEICQMSSTEAQKEANMLRTLTGQGSHSAQSLEKYSGPEDYAASSKDYSKAEEELSKLKKLAAGKGSQEEYYDNPYSEKDLENAQRAGEGIAQEQVRKEERRSIYQKLQREFRKEEGKENN